MWPNTNFLIMSDLITLITPTGGRQACFNLYAKYIARQTHQGPIQLIVIDDCLPKITIPQLPKNISVEYYRGPKAWESNFNTQRLNLDFAIDKIKGAYIFFPEDDDWISKNYLAFMLNLLRNADLVGEANAKYYNVRIPGHKCMLNHSHASLSQTGISSKILPLFREAVNSGELYIDFVTWKKAKERGVTSVLISNSGTCVGMKGLPGRDGITGSHRSNDFQYDPGWVKLEEWIGVEDVASYKKLAKQEPPVKINSTKVVFEPWKFQAEKAARRK